MQSCIRLSWTSKTECDLYFCGSTACATWRWSYFSASNSSLISRRLFLVTGDGIGSRPSRYSEKPFNVGIGIKMQILFPIISKLLSCFILECSYFRSVKNWHYRRYQYRWAMLFEFVYTESTFSAFVLAPQIKAMWPLEQRIFHQVDDSQIWKFVAWHEFLIAALWALTGLSLDVIVIFYLI